MEFGPKHLSADRPITGRSGDKLGRSSFADAVASAIRSWRGHDSLVLALYGEWGSGKSSIKNMILEALRIRSQGVVPLVAEFNPWRFANHDQLSERFFDEIGVLLGRGTLASGRDKKVLLRRWRLYSLYLRTATDVLDLIRRSLAGVLLFLGLVLLVAGISASPKWLMYLGLTVTAAALVTAWSKRFAAWITGILEAKAAAGRESLEEVKGKLADLLRDLKQPVLVVLDDVDRLTPEEVLVLFQLVKSNADFPNLVYLFVFDRIVIERHLERVLGEKGKDYLEKVVQVGFDVPMVDRVRVRRILFEGISQSLELSTVSQRFDSRRWGNLFYGAIEDYFRNLRDVNRFLSTFAFHVAVFRGQDAFEVNPVDLIALEALRVFEPDIHSAVATNKELLTSRHERRLGERDERGASLRRIFLDPVPMERRERVQNILRQLFPEVASSLGGFSSGSGSEDEWYRDLRVASENVFDRYFQLAIPEGDISQSAIDRILALAGNRNELRREFEILAERNLLDVALNRLEAYKERLPIENAVSFATALFDVGHLVSDDRRGFLETEPSMHALRIVYWCVRQESDANRRFEILSRAIGDTKGVDLPVRFVGMLEPRPDRTYDESFLPLERFELFKQTALNRIRAAQQDGALKSARNLGAILYRWRDWAGIEEPKGYCENLAASPEGAIRLVGAFLSRSVSAGIEDRVASEQCYITLGNVEEFVSWETIEAVLAGAPTENLAERDSLAVATFREAVARRRRGLPDQQGGYGRED